MSREGIDLVAFTLERGERARVRIHGSSMRPTLRDGMMAEVEALSEMPQAGEILLYDTGEMLVAHRFIKSLSDERFLICGDAHPKVIEHISRKRILGRVVRVWESEEPAAREVSAGRLHFFGQLMMRSRALRATRERAVELVECLRFRRQTTTFRDMTLAIAYFIREDWSAAVALIDAFEPRYFFGFAARHGLGGILHRLFERSNAAGFPVRGDFVEGVRSGRWMSALRADEILARAREIQSILHDRVVAPIYLKGAARLLRGDVDADLHFSSDVDLILPPDQADLAVELLRGRGYDHHVGADERAMYYRWRQHRAPLWNGDAVVPIEIHTRLCIPGSVGQEYDYRRLLGFSQQLDAGMHARVLNPVGTAIHLAYHGRDCRVLRDIYLLATVLPTLDAAAYTQFMQLIGSEKRDGVRLRSAVYLAHRFAGMSIRADAAELRYLSWLGFREDLPFMFQKRSHILEGMYARCLPPYQGLTHIRRHLYTWLYNAVATPMLFSWYRSYHDATARAWLQLLE